MTPERKRLAAWSGLVARTVAYQLPDGIEIETSEGLELVRRRVFFEEATMVALHREHGPLFLILTAVHAAVFGVIGLMLLFSGSTLAVGLIFLGIAVPGAVAFLLRAILGVEVVTVIGRRSRASIRFARRKRRARETYGALCNAVRDAHRRLEAEYAAAAPPPPAPSGELPPEPPSGEPPAAPGELTLGEPSDPTLGEPSPRETQEPPPELSAEPEASR